MENAVAINMMRRICVGDVIRRRSLKTPKDVAIIMNYKGTITRRATYEEINREANRFANAIMELGVKKGDRVVIFSHNCVQYVVFMGALAKMGAWITPLNFALKSREIIPLINHSEPVMIIVEDALMDTVLEVDGELPSVKHRVMINLDGSKALPPGWLDFDALCSERYSNAEPEVEINGDDILTLMYTSGTEAMPKGVMNSHANWFSTIMSNAIDALLSLKDSAASGQVITRNPIGLAAAPLFHVAGHSLIFSGVFATGGYVLLYLPDPQVIMKLFQAGEVTSGALAPTVLVNLLGMPGGEDLIRSLWGKLEWAILYGSPASETLLRKIMELLPNCRFQNYYGQSELTPLGCTLFHDNLLPKTILANERFDGAEPIGQPHTNVEMKVFDEYDREVPPGTLGELVARSPSVMMGYYKDPERTAEAFRTGWLHTGDLGRMDEEYFFYFVDRKKDIIRSGAENISSFEVEQWVAKHPRVAECTAVGLPHARWGEAVTVFVVPQPGTTVTEEEIIQHCRDGIAGYKCPKRVILLPELPKNPSGKILKKDLRKQYRNLFAVETL